MASIINKLFFTGKIVEKNSKPLLDGGLRVFLKLEINGEKKKFDQSSSTVKAMFTPKANDKDMAESLEIGESVMVEGSLAVDSYGNVCIFAKKVFPIILSLVDENE